MSSSSMLFVTVLLSALSCGVQGERARFSDFHLDERGLQTDDAQEAAGLQQRQEAYIGEVLHKRYVLEEIMTSSSYPGKVFPKLAKYKDGRPSHLGKGSFGDAWKAFDKERQTYVAVKIFYNSKTMQYILPNTTDADEIEDLADQDKECQATQALIAKQDEVPEPERDWAKYLCQCFEDHIKGGPDGEPAYLVMEMCGSSVEDLVIKPNKTDVKLARQIVQGVVRAIAYMNKLKPPMIHHDLKPLNLCVNEEGTVKLIDWGGLLEATGKNKMASVVYTPAYEAPECRTGWAWKTKSWGYDMYSAGLIYSQLLCPAIQTSAWYDDESDILLHFDLKRSIQKECPDLDVDALAGDIELAKDMSKTLRLRADPWKSLEKLQQIIDGQP